MFTGHFSQKSPGIGAFWAKNDLQLKAILWVFATLYKNSYSPDVLKLELTYKT